jgi:hypothetical protein
LSEAGVCKIAEWSSPDFAGPLSEWLLRTSEGNPYVERSSRPIMAELLRHARKTGIPSVATTGKES